MESVREVCDGLPDLPGESWPEWSATLRSQITFDGIGQYVSMLPPLVLEGRGHVLPATLVKSLLRSLEATGPFTEKGKRSTKTRTIFAHQRKKIQAAIASCRDALDEESARDFGRALIALWKEHKFDSRMRWCAWGAGVFGDDMMALEIFELMRTFQRKKGKWGYYKAIDLLEVLLSLDSRMAKMTLGYYASLGDSKLQRRADDALEARAKEAQITRAELEDRIIPACGFRGDGRQELDFGARRLHVTVGENFYPVLKTPAGKVLKQLPRKRAGDDPVAFDEAKAEWKYLREGLVHVFRVQRVRLELALIERRRWRASDWEQHIASHPLMVLFARNLLWGCFDDEDVLSCAFRVVQDGTLADIEDEHFTLPEGGRIGLVHPLDLSESSRQRWGDLFMDYELIAPIAQLGRPCYSLANEDDPHHVSKRFEGRTGAPRHVRTYLKYHGFAHPCRFLSAFRRHSAREDVTTIIALSPGLASDYAYDEPQRVSHVAFVDGKNQPLELKQVDPILFSEAILAGYGVLGGEVDAEA